MRLTTGVMSRFGSCWTSAVFDDALAGAGLTDDEAQAALLAVDAQGIEDLLLMGQQAGVVLGEGAALEAKMCADHDVGSLAVTGLRSLA